MKRGIPFLVAGILLLALALLFACVPVTPAPLPTVSQLPSAVRTLSSILATVSPEGSNVSGVVLDQDGSPVADAAVRVKATNQETVTDSNGRFILSGLPSSVPIFVAAWKAGYFNNGLADVQPGAVDVEITLNKQPASDNLDYQWLSAFSIGGQAGNCQNCHADPQDLSALLPFPEWQKDAHALSTQNVRFLTMYTGTNVAGNQSLLTRYTYNIDYGRVPLPPDLTQPYYGPGYKLDFPGTTGICADCHAPAAAIDAAYGTDPTSVSGVGREGIACDFCHKVLDVQLNPETGTPYPNMPGVLSFVFRRPPEGHQFFAGPFDDVAPGEDTYAPIQSQSQFCAPCHFDKFWGTQIYNSFGEWLESPYSDPVRAKAAGLSSSKSCQDCHMPHVGATTIALPAKGAVKRNPQTIFSHLMPGASDQTLLRNAVTLTDNANRTGNQITVTVTILNDKTGHDIPTDSPLRQIILLVSAKDGQGSGLPLQDGPVVPDWGGVGNPNLGYYAGLPGKGYAKILMEQWTETSPTGAYWNPTRIVSDNRIPALGSDTSSFVFTAPAQGPVSIKVSLLFRRAFIGLMTQKGWNVPDILMAQTVVTIPAKP